MEKYKIVIIIKIIIILTAIISSFIIFYQQLNMRDQPNILLITIDTLRPDHLSCYGYKRNTSPNIDRLAKEGVIFTNAIAQSNNTLSSVPSFITSSYPYMHLIEYEELLTYLNPETSTLADILRQKGYKTAMFNDYPDFLRRIQGIKSGFEYYFEIGANNPAELTQLVLNWLQQNKTKKFFIWLYYHGAHGPYNPSLPYSKIFLYDEILKTNKRIPIAIDDAKEFFGVIPKHIAEADITDIDYYIAKYDGKIRIIDEQIGLSLQGLEKMNLDKNTLIILISDHGEGLGEHNYYFRHGAPLYDELLKVPLIIKDRHFISKNKIISCQVELIDVVPTILDILNISRKRFQGMEGISLKPYILGRDCNNKRYAFSTSSIFFSIRSEDYKLIYIDHKKIKEIPTLQQRYGNLNEYELYNLKNDPYETKNLINEEKKVFESLKQELEKYIIKARQQEDKFKQLLEKNAKNKIFIPLNEETKKRLRNLGYIQ